MNKGINLLKSNKKNGRNSFFHRLNILRIISVGLLFIVPFLSVSLFILISLTPLPELKEQERSAKFNLSHYNEDIIKMQLVNKRIQDISAILSKRPSFDEKIEIIKNKMPQELELKSLLIEKNTISVKVSSKSLLVVDTFLNNLRNSVDEEKEFSRITVSTLSRNEQANAFLLSVDLLSYE